MAFSGMAPFYDFDSYSHPRPSPQNDDSDVFWNSGDDRSRSMRFFECSARLVQFVHHLQQVGHALRRFAVQFVLLLFVVEILCKFYLRDKYVHKCLLKDLRNGKIEITKL